MSEIGRHREMKRGGVGGGGRGGGYKEGRGRREEKEGKN